MSTEPPKRAIWKFEVPLPDTLIETIPSGSYIVAVGQQAGELVFWAEVDPTRQEYFPRRFRIVATGEVYPAGLDYHGTVQMPSGLVWHLMEDSDG